MAVAFVQKSSWNLQIIDTFICGMQCFESSYIRAYWGWLLAIIEQLLIMYSMHKLAIYNLNWRFSQKMFGNMQKISNPFWPFLKRKYFRNVFSTSQNEEYVGNNKRIIILHSLSASNISRWKMILLLIYNPSSSQFYYLSFVCN